MLTVNDRIDFLLAVDDLIPPRPMCIEIGVLFGDFSQQILDVLYPLSLVLIDPYVESDNIYEGALAGTKTAYSTEAGYKNLLKRFELEIFEGQVTVDRNFSYNVVGNYPYGNYDAIYIDASHTYKDVKRDLNDWMPKLKASGLMLGHDFFELDGFGVKQAVNEFMEEWGYEMIILNVNGGDFALKRKQ